MHIHSLRFTVLLAALLAGGAFAQGITQGTRIVQPSNGTGAVRQGGPAVAPGAPAAGGLNSPSPFPQGLPSPQPYPGGIPSSAIVPPGTAQPGTGNITDANGNPTAPASTSGATDAVGTTIVPQNGVVPQTGVAGAGAMQPPQFVPAGPSGYTALQIAQSFRAADANLNGELTRAEAARLPIMPSSFEEMDRNKDGVLSRSEYEDGLR